MDNKNIFDFLLEGCQIIDENFRYIYINDAAAKQGQKTKEELLGKSMMEAYPGIENTEVFRHLRRCLEENTSYNMLNEFQFPNGSKRWFELRMTKIPQGVFILSLDITDRKKSEDRFKKLVANSKDMMHIVDKTGKILYVTPSVINVVGYTPEEFVQKNGNDYIHPDDVPSAMESFNQILNSSQKVLGPFQFRVRHKDGFYGLTEVTGVNLTDDPDIGGIVVTSRDITAWINEQEELTKRNDELEKLNKLMVGRELKMVELKKQNTKLQNQFVPNKESDMIDKSS